MKSGQQNTIHALEFGCQAPLRFYEHCASCPGFGEGCDDLLLGKELLRGKKRLVYNGEDHDDGTVHASSFKCIAPLSYFEKTRSACGHKGRCREEGLLLALLSERKELTYAQKMPIEFPRQKKRRRPAKTEDVEPNVYYVR
jgi:hypothetical protein